MRKFEVIFTCGHVEVQVKVLASGPENAIRHAESALASLPNVQIIFHAKRRVEVCDRVTNKVVLAQPFI